MASSVFQRRLFPGRGARQARGFTLMEILLVLAILVAVMAVAAPAFTGAIQNHRLRTAADTVRAQFTRAHVTAMKTGRIQVFRYEIGGKAFQVEPWVAGDDALEASVSTSFAPVQPTMPDEQRIDEQQGGVMSGRELPDDIIFAGGDAQAESRSIEIEAALQGGAAAAAQWSRPIMFYPDGATSDAFLIVASPREVGIRVDLRGMTGTATVGEITAIPELLQ